MWYVYVTINRVLGYLISMPSWPQQETRLRTLRLSKDPALRSLIIAILHSRQPTLWLDYLFLEVLSVHYNELHLFGAMAFPHTRTIAIICAFLISTTLSQNSDDNSFHIMHIKFGVRCKWCGELMIYWRISGIFRYYVLHFIFGPW